MQIITDFLTSTKARPRTKRSRTTKIAWHWIGNANTSAKNNRNYFNTCGKAVSSHYIIGLSGEVLYIVPEEEIAYTTNEANSYSIGIECCHPDWTGKFSDVTYASMVELGVNLCKKYNLNPINDFIRHYDVTKKCCPKYFVENPSAWAKFKQDVYNKMHNTSNTNSEYQIGTYKQNVKIASSDGVLSVRAGRGTENAKLGEFKTNDVVNVWYIDKGSNGKLWGSCSFNGTTGFISMDCTVPVNAQPVEPPVIEKPVEKPQTVSWTLRLQKELNAQGFKDDKGRRLSEDGIAGPSTLSACPLLKEGAKGNITKLMQEKVGSSADGIFGSGTKTKVIAYQKSKSLSADGIVGKGTWSKFVNL